MRLCIYAGSNSGALPAYRDAAAAVGRSLARRGIGIVYGGGNVGLMGVLADAALAEGGDVVGVIPTKLVELEVAHQGLPELIEVGSMHERKRMMADLADAFLALPGGIGTMEELFEVWTWSQIGYHDKPCGLLNVAGYYDPLIAFLDAMVDQKFLVAGHRAFLHVGNEAEALIDTLTTTRSVYSGKWIDRGGI